MRECRNSSAVIYRCVHGHAYFARSYEVAVFVYKHFVFFKLLIDIIYESNLFSRSGNSRYSSAQFFGACLSPLLLGLKVRHVQYLVNCGVCRRSNVILWDLRGLMEGTAACSHGYCMMGKKAKLALKHKAPKTLHVSV